MSTMNKISVYIIAYNEATKIKAALESVIDWADEVIVADSYSTDNTATIAAALGAKVIQLPFTGFGELRNRVIEHCQYEWIFSLDSDERCTPQARDEIISIVKNHTATMPDIYLVPRKNYFLGKWVKHSGWYPNYRQPQLFRKGKMHYTTEAVHEGYVALGVIGKLHNPIWQFPFENLAQMLHKINRYSTLNAQRLLGKKRGGLWRGLLSGMVLFIKHYIFQRGFLDGRAGFAIALGSGIGGFYKYAKLAELENHW